MRSVNNTGTVRGERPGTKRRLHITGRRVPGKVQHAVFSYEFRRQSILPCPPPREIDTTMPLSYNVDEYHFSEELRLGVHKKIGFVVVFHPDVRKNYIIPPEMFEAYAQAVLRRLRMMRDIMRLLRVKEELYLKITPCEIGEAGFENTRGTISPQCLPLPAMPLHFGWGCDCGVIRKQFREMSRHECIHKESTRYVAFQKFPLKLGLMCCNFEVYCPTDNRYLENLVKTGRTTSRPPMNHNRHTTSAPELQHHPLVKKILQEVPRERVGVHISAMKQATNVGKISKLLVGVLTLLSANVNYINLASLDIVRLLNGGNRRQSRYFRAVQTYLTCVQYSKYMAELVYMTLVKSLYTDPATLAVTEMLDSYGNDVVFEVNAHDYEKLTGYAQFITAEERLQILGQTFSERSLRAVDQLVLWIMKECVKKDFNESLTIVLEQPQQQRHQQHQQELYGSVDVEGDDIVADLLDTDGAGIFQDDESAIMEAMSSAEAEASLQGGGESQSPADSLRMLYYPTYNEDAGGGGDRHEEEGGEPQGSYMDNAFLVCLGFLGSKYPTKKYCRSLSGISYVTKACILFDILNGPGAC